MHARATRMCLLLALAGATTAFADPNDPPAGYYTNATGIGPTLKSNLRTIISTGFISRSYGDARFALPLIDRDPNNSNNVILVYTGQSVPSTWDAGLTWNREHTWPDSYGNSSGPNYSDYHMLRPCNPSVNSARGNEPFGLNSASLWDPTQPGSPIQYRGEIARTMFYAATRYGDAGGSTTTGPFILVDSGFSVGVSRMGVLTSLLAWHFENPVDERERLRNQRVFSQVLNPTYYQNNRNPFVDRPEFVWAIWGPTPNNSQLSVATPNAGGASARTVTFGPVITGAPAFGTQNVVLDKTGVTPTTYDIIVSGAATSNFSGPRKAFAFNPQSRVLAVGVTTSGVGSYTGTIVVDNTDLTSAGAGQGANDANDVITVNASILSHASPSFTTPAATTSRLIDFGSVPQNSGTHTQPAPVYNLLVTPGLTASLDVDGWIGTPTPASSSSVFSFSLPSPVSIAAGSANSSVVSLDSANPPGTYQVVYTINTSDQDLPGAIIFAPLTLTVLGEITANCPGDLNGDLVVDNLDFVIFADAYAIFDCTDPLMPAGCPADLTADLVVDNADFAIFAQAYSEFLCP